MSVLRILLIVIGIVVLVWFLVPSFVTHNFHIGVLTGTAIGIMLVLYGIFMEPVNAFIAGSWKTVTGKIVYILILVICAAIIALAAACSVSMISASSNKAEKGCTVIVLGARVYPDHVSLTLSKRLNAAYDYLVENPDSVCIVSGGQGKNETCTEASLMYDYLVNKGIDETRIIQEDKSTDTDENLEFSKKIIEDRTLNPSVGLATDGYHEYRALSYARKKGIEAAAIPSETVWWLWPSSVVREMYGILEMWILK